MTETYMTISELQEKLDEVIDEGLTIHITSDLTDDVIAVLIPYDDFQFMKNELKF